MDTPLEPQSMDSAWIQFELELDPAPRGFHERASTSLREIWDVVSDWRDHGTVLAWFLRKAPGLRIRVWGDGVPAQGSRALSRVLDGHRARHLILNYETSHYEPEIHRFGGAPGLAVAHAFLNASANAWVAWDHARQQGNTRSDRTLVAAAIFDGLVVRMTNDLAERWDVWCRLTMLVGGVAPAPGKRPDGPRIEFAALATVGAPEERGLLRQMFAANARCAAAFDEIRRELALGPRTFLVSLAAFHWNVWCTGGDDLGQLCELMSRELDPLPAQRDAL